MTQRPVPNPMPRRGLLGSLAALAAAPFVFGRSLTSGLFRRVASEPTAQDGRPAVNPPSHSVKRRG